MENAIGSQQTVDYQQLFELLPTLCVLLSPELLTLTATDAYLQAVSESRETFAGKYFPDLFTDGPTGHTCKERFEQVCRLVLDEKKPHTLPALPLPQGSTKDKIRWHVTAKPVPDTSGEVTYLLLEISEATGASPHADDSQSMFDAPPVAGTGSSAMWECDVRNKHLTWTETYKELFGYGDEDLQLTFPDSLALIHPADTERITKAFADIFALNSKVFTLQYRFRKADGTYTRVLNHGYSMYDAAGKPVRLIGSLIDLSKQRAHEQELQASTQRFERVAKATNDVVWDWDLQDDSLWWNDGFQTLFGYPEEAACTADSWTSHLHPDDAEEVKTSLYKAIADGEENWSAEYRFLCANGSAKLVLDKGYVIREKDGTPVRMVGAMVDITEKKRAEQELHENIAHTRQVLEALPLLVWTASADGSVQYFSQRWYDYTGTTFEQIKTQGWAAILHPDDLEQTGRLWREALSSGKDFVTENRWKSARDGTYRWFLVRSVPIRDKAGKITSWVGTQTDIEAQKQVLLALEESNQKFRFLAESIPQMVWTARPDGYHDYFNRRWTDYTHLSAQEGRDTNWLLMIHPDDRARTQERWQYSLDTGTFYEAEFRLRNGSNDIYRWFLGQAMPMRDQQGNIVKWFGSCTDIEAHKRAEEELVEKNLELAHINQDLDSFVYTASHDLKLPVINMAAIFEELVASATFTDPDAHKMVGMFHKSLQQLQNTINDLAEVVKVQKVKARHVEQVDLQEITDEVAVSLQDNRLDAALRVTTDFADVPAVPFTRASLKSVIYNLLSNAIKYKVPGRMPEVHLSTALKGDFVQLKVTDNGLGIDMARHQDKLFQMFKRFHSHVNGSGLGLYIVNRLLANHGGYVTIESTLNEGTTFYLYFKQKKALPVA